MDLTELHELLEKDPEFVKAENMVLRAEVERLRVDNADMRREILAAEGPGPDGEPQSFDWSVLWRLRRLDDAEAKVECLRDAMRQVLEVSYPPGKVYCLLSAALSEPTERSIIILAVPAP